MNTSLALFDSRMPQTEKEGRRIQIVGSTNSGKSTLAARLAARHQIPFVDLDALNWQANWTSLQSEDPEAFREKIRSATHGPSWIVAGDYTAFSKELVWPHLDIIYWLDLPLPQLTLRLLRRSYRRWSQQEILWGGNTEKFWPQFALWKEESLLRWLWMNHRRQREDTLEAMNDKTWAHIEFIHLRSQQEVDSL